jgi:ubiquinone biosynthesis protein UbiJ
MITAGLNRLLQDNPSQQQRLRTFAGQHVELVILARYGWQITAQGLLQSSRTAADATIRIPLSTLPLLLVDRAAFNRTVTIEGEEALGIAFARTLSQLQWDSEEWLSHIVGDVLARRMVGLGRSLLEMPQQRIKRLLQTLVMYYQEETGEIVKQTQLASFYGAVDTLRADMDRLEKRIALLTKVD